MTAIVLWITFVIMLLLGMLEKRSHVNKVETIPIRINVNGIRGKSTVTRLITASLAHAGFRAMGKTTGTAPRLIFGNDKEEKEIHRRPEGPNIREQKLVIAEAAKLDANALVSECMAVNPDYQETFQDQFLQANIGVIVNVLEDHLDVMGPTLKEIADAFTATIPYKGKLVVSRNEFTNFFAQVASERGTEIFIADESRISSAYLNQFEYVIFPENAAIALAVAEVLGIPTKTALEGMLLAKPDPGALQITELSVANTTTYFVNGFAANEPASTLKIWERIKALDIPTNNTTVIMNCRADRVDRTIQFAKECLPLLPISTLVAIGQVTEPIRQAVADKSISASRFIDLEGMSPQGVFDQVQPYLAGGLVLGVGNIHGTAEELLQLLNGSSLTHKERVLMHTSLLAVEGGK